jgi:iron complex outermembrane receptor protein
MNDIPRTPRRACTTLLALAMAGVAVRAPANTADLATLSLEDLMGIEVTSVSKKAERLSESAAAIFVLTGEDIRKSGATSIPEALRLVPGLSVARISADKWAITARSMNSRFANKLLVLVDGRSVYTPLFAGVYWENLDYALDDISRIEVIRGPGSSLWGANAVNGVINIITKDAHDTQGLLASAAAGDELRGAATARYGGKLGEHGAFRTYGKGRGYDQGFAPTGGDDDNRLAQAGFRADWSSGTRDRFTVSGDAYEGRMGQQVTIPTDPAPAMQTLSEDADVGGANLLGRWERQPGDAEALSAQIYLDHVSRDEAVLQENRDTFDIEFQHRLPLATQHDLVYGLGFRRVHDNTDSTSSFALDPASRDADLWSAFVQDEYTLVPERWRLVAGAKFEHNDFTGFEFQPNLRLAYTPDAHTTWWGAVSRAVRTPARGEHDVRLRVVAPAPAPVILTGSDDFNSEELVAYELGWRTQPRADLNLDLAAYYHDYDELRTADVGAMPPPAILMPFGNRLEGHSYGLELAAHWQPHEDWRLQLAANVQRTELRLTDGSQDTRSELGEDTAPDAQLSLWSRHRLRADMDLDLILRHVGAVDHPAPGVDAYTTFDLRLAKRFGQHLELALVGQNLGDTQHAEFQPDFIATEPTEVERGAYLSLTWRD